LHKKLFNLFPEFAHELLACKSPRACAAAVNGDEPFFRVVLKEDRVVPDSGGIVKFLGDLQGYILSWFYGSEAAE
jgi:hypothetical protein